MPSPIQPNNSNGSGISFLPTISPESLDLSGLSSYVSASTGDTEAEMLIDLWNNGKRVSGHKYLLPTGFPNKNLMRLKASGLINVNGSNVEFTNKASGVIKTMVLAEQNRFYKSRQKKPYSLILAESKRPVRKSQLTHTAQRSGTQNRAPTSGSTYIRTRRYALINQRGSNDSFKEYTVRIYLNGDRYEVWGFSGRIGGTMTAWPKGSFTSRREAELAYSKQCDIQTSSAKGYVPASSYGEVVSQNPSRDGRRAFNLAIENASIPGHYDPDAIPGATNQINERPAPEPSRNSRSPRRPSRPSRPSPAPTAPAVVPTKHIEDRELPEGYSIEGPSPVGISPSGTPLTGYYVKDPEGKPVMQSIADTPAQARQRAIPMLDLVAEEKRLPEGYSIAGPPRDETQKNLFITRDPTGLPIGIEQSAKGAVDKAIAWAKDHPDIKSIRNTKQTPEENPILIEQKKKASELSSQLPSGYRFENGMNGASSNAWFVVNNEGNPVSINDSGKDLYATGKSPEEAFASFDNMRKVQAKQTRDALLEQMKNRFRRASTETQTVKTAQEIAEDPILGFYNGAVNGNNPENQKRKDEFLKKASDFLSKVGEGLRSYGFSEITPLVFEGGTAISGWVSSSYFMKNSENGLRAIIGFELDASDSEPEITPSISFVPISGKNKITSAGAIYKHPVNKGPEEMVKSMVSVFKDRNPNEKVKFLPETARSLAEILWGKMNEKRR
ncbi:MAG: hypothetical protein M0R32_06240 [Candidatus Cloacimonetes bacterium]|jgi:hypothetical protein|nr:hypothetical protein [Candidatus Cloacimonadota bacterium]